MKHVTRISTAVLVLAALTSKPVSAADSDSVDIQITGEAKSVCHLSTASQTAGNNAQFTNNTLTIQKLLDDNTAIVKASSSQILFPAVMCNYGANISLATLNGGLISDGHTTDLTGGAFLTKVNYTVTGTWGSVTLPTLDTETVTPGSVVTFQAAGANRGDLVLTFSVPDGNVPVVEGQFNDTLILKVGAAY